MTQWVSRESGKSRVMTFQDIQREYDITADDIRVAL
jgi:hypothetical protein